MPKKEESILLDVLQDIRNDLSRMDRDLGHDRSDIEKFSMRLSAVEEAVSSLSKRFEGMQNRMSDRISDAVAPLVESTDNLTTAIEENTVVAVKGSSFYTRILSKLRRRKEGNK